MEKLKKFLGVFFANTLILIAVNYLMDNFIWHETTELLTVVGRSVVVALVLALVFTFWVKKVKETEGERED